MHFHFAQANPMWCTMISCSNLSRCRELHKRLSEATLPRIPLHVPFCWSHSHSILFESKPAIYCHWSGQCRFLMNSFWSQSNGQSFAVCTQHIRNCKLPTKRIGVWWSLHPIRRHAFCVFYRVQSSLSHAIQSSHCAWRAIQVHLCVIDRRVAANWCI